MAGVNPKGALTAGLEIDLCAICQTQIFLAATARSHNPTPAPTSSVRALKFVSTAIASHRAPMPVCADPPVAGVSLRGDLTAGPEMHPFVIGQTALSRDSIASIETTCATHAKRQDTKASLL